MFETDLIGEREPEERAPEMPEELISAAEDIMDVLDGGAYAPSPSEADSRVQRESKEAARRAKANVLAEVLHNFFMMCDSGPHEEGPPE